MLAALAGLRFKHLLEALHDLAPGVFVRLEKLTFLIVTKLAEIYSRATLIFSEFKNKMGTYPG